MLTLYVLMADDDGKAWFCGNCMKQNGPEVLICTCGARQPR